MSEADWLACPQWIWFRLPPGLAPSDRQMRLWAVACGRRTAAWVEHPELSGLLDAAEWFADQPYSADQHRHLERRADDAVRAVQADGLGHEFCAFALSVRAALDFSPCWNSVCVLNQDAVCGSWEDEASDGEFQFQFALFREIVGNPFRPVAFDPTWRTPTIEALAVSIYAARAFDQLPILADALEDAGCDAADLLAHLRGPGPHVRGCRALDLVLGKS